MCNHYRNAILKGETIPGWSIDQFSEIRIPLRFSNLPVDVYPDKPGIVFVQRGDGLEAVSMRWGFPKNTDADGKIEKGASWVTNARHVMNKSGPAPYWAEWTGPEYRCLVPATSFLEPDQRTVGSGAFREVEFARADGLPFFLAGMWRPWSGVRGTKKDPVEGDHELYTFLTTSPNALVKPIHSKAMPVMLTSWDACETWLNEPIAEAITVQRPLPEEELAILPPPPKESA
jgi:putative SOS response-associated peptidase YedK